METIHARVGSFWSRNEPTIPQGLPPSIAKNPAPRSPFIRSARVSHSESENCDSFAYVELNACGASCSARRRTALKTRVFSGVIGSIVIKRVPKGSNRTRRFVRFYDTTSRMTGKLELNFPFAVPIADYADKLFCLTMARSEESMFVAHFAIGFGAKRWAPKTSVGTLLFAALLADLLVF